jgi:hypothetical protein
MALPLPERSRAPMGVIAGKAKRGHFLGLAMLEFSRDLLIAATCFQSEYLERPNAQVNRQKCGAFLGACSTLVDTSCS